MVILSSHAARVISLIPIDIVQKEALYIINIGKLVSKFMRFNTSVKKIWLFH